MAFCTSGISRLRAPDLRLAYFLRSVVSPWLDPYSLIRNGLRDDRIRAHPRALTETPSQQ